MLQEESRFKCIGLFPDAKSALQNLPQLKPDIVLMDINMPGMKGIECIRELKPQMPDTNFVILTVYNESDYIFDALSAGAVGYLLKRAIVEELIPALEEVARGGSPMNGEIARKVVQRFHTAEEAPPQNRTSSKNFRNAKWKCSPCLPGAGSARRLPTNSTFRPTPSTPIIAASMKSCTSTPVPKPSQNITG